MTWSRVSVAAVVALALVPALALAQVYVDASPPGMDTASCGNTTHPCATLAFAVQQRVSEGGQVRLLPGTHVLSSAVTLPAGGLVGSGSNTTVLDLAQVSSGNDALTGNTTFVLRAVTLANYHGSGASARFAPVGDAVVDVADVVFFNCTSTSASPLHISAPGIAAASQAITDVSFDLCSGVNGGGLFLTTRSIEWEQLHRLSFVNCSASNGAGAHLTSSSTGLPSQPVLRDTRCQDNVASADGGCMVLVGAWTLDGLIAEGGVAGARGGAVVVEDSVTPAVTQLRGSVVIRNNTANAGGGVFVVSGDHDLHGTVTGNTAVGAGGGGGVSAALSAVMDSNNANMASGALRVFGNQPAEVACESISFGCFACTGCTASGVLYCSPNAEADDGMCGCANCACDSAASEEFLPDRLACCRVRIVEGSVVSDRCRCGPDDHCCTGSDDAAVCEPCDQAATDDDVCFLHSPEPRDTFSLLELVGVAAAAVALIMILLLGLYRVVRVGGSGLSADEKRSFQSRVVANRVADNNKYPLPAPSYPEPKVGKGKSAQSRAVADRIAAKHRAEAAADEAGGDPV